MDVGGQAVIEGVMMRNKDKFAVAVRKKDGSIKVMREKSAHFPKFFNVIFLRGVIGLGYALYDGIRALVWSSNQSMDEVEEKLSKKEVIGTVGLSFLVAIAVFVAIPFFSAKLLHSEGIWFNVLDGVFRIVLFLGYLALISRMKDVKTLFQYHGAEHKAVYCHEEKKELTVENVQKYSRFHPRCGTSFLFIILLLSIILFSFVQGSLWIKFIGRILLLPVIAGIGYELIKLSGKYQKNQLVQVLIAPGLWLQRITTNEPTDEQLEVSIAAIKSVLE